MDVINLMDWRERKIQMEAQQMSTMQYPGATLPNLPGFPLKSQTTGKIAEALSKAQLEIKNAIKDKNNPFFKSSYADLASVWEACREPLSKNNIAVSQPFSTDQNGKLILTTLLLHSSGEWLASQIPIVSVKQDPQSIGSAITYFKRFSLSAITMVTPSDDDDGNAASDNKTPAQSNQNKSAMTAAINAFEGKIKSKIKEQNEGPALLNPDALPDNQTTPAIERGDLVKAIFDLKPMFKEKFPQANFKVLLNNRYQVNDTPLMSVEKLSDLLQFMQGEISGNQKPAIQTANEKVDWYKNRTNQGEILQDERYVK